MDSMVCTEFIEAIDSYSISAMCRGTQTLLKIELNKAVHVSDSQSTCMLSKRLGSSIGISVGCCSRALACSEVGGRLLWDSASTTSFSCPGRYCDMNEKLKAAPTKKRQQSKCIRLSSRE